MRQEIAYWFEKVSHGDGGDPIGFRAHPKTYRKEYLVAKIADKTKMSKKESRTMVNAFVETVKETMKKNDKVALVGFGTFGVKERQARKGVNPKTLKAITIPKKKAMFFKPGKALKDAVAKK